MVGFFNFIYRFYPLAIAALLAAGAIWLERATRSLEHVTAAAISQTPDFIAETVRITGFTEDGKLHYILDSPRIAHLPLTDSTQVKKPRLQLVAQGRHMEINADDGEVGPKGTQVDFIGNVEAERESAPGEMPLRLSSAQLTVWPQEQRAISDVPVRLTQGETRTDGDNLVADNVFGVMKLSGNVRMLLISRNKRNS